MPGRFAPALVMGLSICAGIAAAPGSRADAAPGPERPAALGEIALGSGRVAVEPHGDADLVLQSRLQTAGKALLASAFAFIVAGVTIIEVDPYSLAVGDWGFASVGVGVGTFIASAFLLGLSHPVHIRDHPLERRHAFFVVPARGLALGYARSF
jgi:hypothetical protein